MRVRLLVLLAAAVAAGAAALLVQEKALGAVGAHVLDVGQGDAILLRSGRSDILVDGGPDATVARRLGEVRPAWDRRLEVVVLTHPDVDHLAGLLPVLEREDVGLLVLPAIAPGTDLFRAFLERVSARRVPVRFARPGQQIRAGDLTLTVLAPDEGALRLARRKTNNGGVVLRADLSTPNRRCSQRANRGCLPNGFSALLTADIERPAEQRLLARARGLLEVDILKVGHHGSKTSTSLRLLRASTRSLAVISSGAENRYGHPHPAIVRRLEKLRLLRTDTHGTVSLIVRRGTVTLACGRGSCGR